MQFRDFERLVNEIFSRQSSIQSFESRTCIRILIEVYKNTILKNRDWVSIGELANIVYKDENVSDPKKALNTSTGRILSRLSEYFKDKSATRPKNTFELVNNNHIKQEV